MSDRRFGGPGEVVALAYRRYGPRLHRILRGFLARFSRSNGFSRRVTNDEIDDLVHDVFVRLLGLRGAAALEPERDPIPYLLTIARNLYVDAQRRGHLRRWEVMPIDAPDRELPESVWKSDESDWFEVRRNLMRLDRCVAGLPESLGRVYDVRFVQGLSQRDAAAALGLTRRRVRTLEAVLVTEARRMLAE